MVSSRGGRLCSSCRPNRSRCSCRGSPPHHANAIRPRDRAWVCSDARQVASRPSDDRTPSDTSCRQRAAPTACEDDRGSTVAGVSSRLRAPPSGAASAARPASDRHGGDASLPIVSVIAGGELPVAEQASRDEAASMVVRAERTPAVSARGRRLVRAVRLTPVGVRQAFVAAVASRSHVAAALGALDSEVVRHVVGAGHLVPRLLNTNMVERLLRACTCRSRRGCGRGCVRCTKRSCRTSPSSSARSRVWNVPSKNLPDEM